MATVRWTTFEPTRTLTRRRCSRFRAKKCVHSSLTLTAGPTVIRIVPPLTITREELERGVTILEEVLS